MSTEANKAIVVQLYEEIFNKGNLDLADKLIAPNAINHDPQLPPSVPGGPQGLKAAVTMLRNAFPDDHHTIEDLVAEGDRVVVRLTHSGTHQGPFWVFHRQASTSARLRSTSFDSLKASLWKPGLIGTI